MKTNRKFTCAACGGDMCKTVDKPEGMVKECLNCGHEHQMKAKRQSKKNKQLNNLLKELIK